MTMPYASHPDDERLAAYADREADALQDRALAAHVSSCDRCGPLVADLAALPAILAALPDIVPSRPLRLIPPVPEPAPRTALGPAGWLRRLTAPAFAAGSGLVLVGAIGASGALGGLNSNAALPGAEDVRSSDMAPTAQSSRAQPSSPEFAVDSSGGQPLASAGEPGNRDGTEIEQVVVAEAPWLAVLAVGLALMLTAVVLRFAIQPRAG